MKKINVAFIFCLSVISMAVFTSCDNNKENVDTELTIQNKIELLEGSQWLLEGFEDNVMYTFVDGKRYKHYGTDGVFGEAIPGTNNYNSLDDLLFIDFNFANTAAYDLKFSCDESIVKFFLDSELNSTLFKLGSNYEECLN